MPNVRYGCRANVRKWRFNDANDSRLLPPMSMAAMEVLQVEELKVLADDGYSNAQAVAQCEGANVEVAAPIKRGAMSSDFFRPTQFTYDEGTDTFQCPAGEMLRLSGKRPRKRAMRGIRSRTPVDAGGWRRSGARLTLVPEPAPNRATT